MFVQLLLERRERMLDSKSDGYCQTMENKLKMQKVVDLRIQKRLKFNMLELLYKDLIVCTNGKLLLSAEERNMLEAKNIQGYRNLCCRI